MTKKEKEHKECPWCHEKVPRDYEHRGRITNVSCSKCKQIIGFGNIEIP